MEICGGYCGVTCVNGYCPNANMDGGKQISCEDCFYYEGCEDCAFAGTKDCIKIAKE